MVGAARSAGRRHRRCRTHAHYWMEAHQALPAFASARRRGPRSGSAADAGVRGPLGAVTVSDRPEDRPIPSLGRASARNARTRTTGRTDGTSAHRAARQPVSHQERAAIWQAGMDDARRSRAGHGFAERVEDSAKVAVLAAILRNARAPPQNQRMRHGSKTAA
jgi:hypothetical protein